MELTFALSQALAFVAFLLGIRANLQQTRPTILVGWSLSALSYTAHLILLSAYDGAALAGTNALRFLTAAYYPGPIGAGIFLIIGIALMWQVGFDNGSLFAFLAFCSGTIGSFFQKELQVRLFMMLTSSLWLTFNALIFSPVAMLAESVFLATNIFATARLLKAK